MQHSKRLDKFSVGNVKVKDIRHSNIPDIGQVFDFEEIGKLLFSCNLLIDINSSDNHTTSTQQKQALSSSPLCVDVLVKKCCKIQCVKENFYGALVRQSIGMYLSDFLRLFTIHTILELSTFNRLDVQRKDSDSIYMLLQRKCTPTLRKTKTDITYS